MKQSTLPVTLFCSTVKRTSRKLTWLEAVCKGNNERRVITPHHFFSGLATRREEYGPAHKEISKNGPFHTGTLAIVGEKGKPFGASVESECEFEGTKKTVIFRTNSTKYDLANLVDIMLLLEHGSTKIGEPLITFSNAKTEKQIITYEGIGEAKVLLLKLSGKIRGCKIGIRGEADFSTIDPEDKTNLIEELPPNMHPVYVNVPGDSACIALLTHEGFDPETKTLVGYLRNDPSARYSVMMEYRDPNVLMIEPFQYDPQRSLWTNGSLANQHDRRDPAASCAVYLIRS